MGVRILVGDRRDHDSENTACFYCSTTGWAFGPTFTSRDQAEMFLKYLGGVDPRLLKDKDLLAKFGDFRRATVECTVCRREIPYAEYYLEHYHSHPCE